MCRGKSVIHKIVCQRREVSDKIRFCMIFRCPFFCLASKTSDIVQNEDFAAFQFPNLTFGFVAENIVNILYWFAQRFAEQFCMLLQRYEIWIAFSSLMCQNNDSGAFFCKLFYRCFTVSSDSCVI